MARRSRDRRRHVIDMPDMVQITARIPLTKPSPANTSTQYETPRVCLPSHQLGSDSKGGKSYFSLSHLLAHPATDATASPRELYKKRAPTEADAPFEPFKAPVRLHLLLFAHFSRSVPCATRLRAIGLCLCGGRSCKGLAALKTGEGARSVPSPFLCNLDSADYARRPYSGPSRLACTHACRRGGPSFPSGIRAWPPPYRVCQEALLTATGRNSRRC